MRLAFDATSMLGRRTGIGNCTEEILCRLPRPGLDVVAFAVSARGARALDSHLPEGVATITRPMAARPLRALWRRADRPVLEHWSGPIDVVHGPNFDRSERGRDPRGGKLPSYSPKNPRLQPQLVSARPRPPDGELPSSSPFTCFLRE